MSEIGVFAYEGTEVRTVVRAGEPWFVLADLCRVLGLTTPARVAERLDPEGVSQTPIPTSGGRQQLTVVNESAMYEVVIRSDKPEAVALRRWITSEVLPSIRRSGSYSAAPSVGVDLGTIRQLNAAVGTLLEENEKITVRAVQAESTVEFIEGSEGLSIRQFHKQYFSDVPEKAFNEALYRHHLLIDQRGTRGRDSCGRVRNGKEHRHPTFRGKPFFALDPTVDRVTGDRYYQTKVRPGAAEVQLVSYLADRGLVPNKNVPRPLEMAGA
jgi:prophage antirepressor-like protein